MRFIQELLTRRLNLLHRAQGHRELAERERDPDRVALHEAEVLRLLRRASDVAAMIDEHTPSLRE